MNVVKYLRRITYELLKSLHVLFILCVITVAEPSENYVLSTRLRMDQVSRTYLGSFMF